MADVTVTGLTAERMLEIEAASVVDGEVVGDDLILTKHDGTTIDAGNVRGPQGDPASSIPKYPDSSSYPATPAVGDYIDDATKTLLRWNGTEWRSPNQVMRATTDWNTATKPGQYLGISGALHAPPTSGASYFADVYVYGTTIYQSARRSTANTFQFEQWFRVSADGGVTWSAWGNPAGEDGWHYFGAAGEPAFASSDITNYGGTYLPGRFIREGRWVSLEGLLKTTAGGSTLPLFTLPVGFRPTQTIIVIADANMNTGAASTGTAHTHLLSSIPFRLDITSSGVTSTVGGLPILPGSHISLTGIRFAID